MFQCSSSGKSAAVAVATVAVATVAASAATNISSSS